MLKTIKSLGIFLALLSAVFFLSILITDSSPPLPSVSAENKSIQTTRGSYCWDAILSFACVDTMHSSPYDLGSTRKPVEVNPDSLIQFKFDEEPDELTVAQWSNEKDFHLVKSTSGFITTPKESGIYVYHLSSKWKQGESNFAFIIKVK